LKWASTPIIFDQDNHPVSVPRPGRYSLIVDPVVSNMRLTKVLMDGGSSLNILYINTLDAMGISRACLRTSLFPFYGILPGIKAYPLGNLDLPVTFGNKDNYHTETLTFEVVDWKGAYHAILGRTMPSWGAPCTPSSWRYPTTPTSSSSCGGRTVSSP
jgi:hypothetical protein